MNKDRRKRIEKLIADIERAQEDILWISEELETLASEEREAFDAMPESIQNGNRGQSASEAADSLDEAVEEYETLIGAFGELLTRLENAEEM